MFRVCSVDYNSVISLHQLGYNKKLWYDGFGYHFEVRFPRPKTRLELDTGFVFHGPITYVLLRVYSLLNRRKNQQLVTKIVQLLTARVC